MSRLPRLPQNELPENTAPVFAMAEQMMGFTPNDVYDMARNPAILQGVAAMCGAIYAPGQVKQGLKRLIGHIASSVAGCRYCRVHTAHGAHEQGVSDEKIKAAWEYETSPLFTPAERAALRVAQAGAMNPSAVTPAMFADLRRHFSDDQVVEIVAVISMFGFLNRWNAIMDTELEDMPLNYAAGIGLEGA